MDINEYMKRSLELQERSVELLAQATGLLTQLGGNGAAALPDKPAATATVQPDKLKKADKPKETEAPVEDKPKDEVVKKKITPDDVRAALMKFGKVQGSEAAVNLLGKYDATSVSSLKAEHYEALIADAQVEDA